MTLAIPEPAGDGLALWADSFTRIASISAQLSRTPFVPASLRVFRENGRVYDEAATAANVASTILTGQELGLQPMAALRSINVIQATPALSALALRALVQSHGHQIVVEEATKTRATVAGRRKGDELWQRITWSMDDAKDRGLAGKPNWKSQPRNMLIARASSEIARLIAADVILGVPYAVEELEDGDVLGGSPVQAVEETPAPRRTAQRRAPARPAIAATSPGQDDPPFDDEPASNLVAKPEPVPDETPAPINDGQMKALHASLNELGLGGAANRDFALAEISSVIGRDIQTTKELTMREATAVLDELALRRAQAAGDDAPPFDDTEADEARP